MNDSEITRHLERARMGDRSAMGVLFEGHRPRLERMVRLRLDRRLRGRVDEADVVQDTFIEAARCIGDYAGPSTMPFILWLRFLAHRRLQGLYREHLGAQKRDARREVSITQEVFPGATSEAIAARLLGKLTTPSQAAVRAETKARLTEAIEQMEPGDREIVALRHFEELTNGEAAHMLGIEEGAASKRYVRAIRRLKSILDQFPGMSELPWK